MSFAQAHDMSSMSGVMGPASCNHMETWNYEMAMCMPLAMPGMPMRMIMLQGNAFATGIFASGPRGVDGFAVPNMFMLDAGSSVGDNHYVNLDFMGTVEKWTFPSHGYPLILQIGEEDSHGRPFVDAQHPHSSPIMGLTLSDTYSLGNKNYFKIWAAPRAASTDGPVAFMHRPTGMVNPDAPLGHHIGQDAGHISSTVLGAAFHRDRITLEGSLFHGEEPEPTEVDLPLGKIDSWATRLIVQPTDKVYAMVSVAQIEKPEAHDPLQDHIWRYSASLYVDHELRDGWLWRNTLIWGIVQKYDHVPTLQSFGEEFLLVKDSLNFWGRFETLQRTPGELQIAAVDPLEPHWATAVTLGATWDFIKTSAVSTGLGASVTHDFLPSSFESAYDGDPWTYKVFLQVSGQNMWAW